jgi:hypothetical protein
MKKTAKPSDSKLALRKSTLRGLTQGADVVGGSDCTIVGSCGLRGSAAGSGNIACCTAGPRSIATIKTR